MKNFKYIVLSLLFLSNLIWTNQQIIQDILVPGTTVPLDQLQFQTALPTFFGQRADGTRPLTIVVEEFQQRILPDSFYDALPSSITYQSAQTGKDVAVINPQIGTYLWGYTICDGQNIFGPSFPGHTIEAQRNIKTFTSNINHLFPFNDAQSHRLPGPLLQKFLTLDLSLHWANPLNYPQFIQCIDDDTSDCPATSACPPDFPVLPATFLQYGNFGFYAGPQPIVVHLHGAEVPSAFDGHPESWFTPGNMIKGPTFVTNKYVYPNTQLSTNLWFHDHTLGETRLNVYAGLAAFYLLRGLPESSVTPSLPSGPFEIEMAIQDRQFDTNGQLFWPDGNPCDAGLSGDPENPHLHPYVIPEFFGDVIIVNGKSWPFLEVEPRRYRFRVLDGSNSRMYGLYLSTPGGDLVNVPTIWQIGSDGGLFDNPVPLTFTPFSWDPSLSPPGVAPYGGPVTINNFPNAHLFLAPGERADIIIDFTGWENSTFILMNGAPAPFPGDDTTYDPDIEGRVLQFRVSGTPVSDTSYNPATDGPLLTGANQNVQFTDGNGNLAPGVAPTIALTRSLTLIEYEHPVTGSPVTALLNNTHYDGINPYTDLPVADSVSYANGTFYVTEIPQVGATEIWELINLTPDAHPIHIHLVQFQILNRQVFNVGAVVPPFGPPFICPPYPNNYRYDQYETAWFGQENPPYPPVSMAETVYGAGSPFPYLSAPNPPFVIGGNPDVTPYLIPPIIPPDPNEALCWKDTIKAFPGTVTRLVVRFAPQTIPVGGVVAGENTFSFDPTAPFGTANDGFGYPGGPGYVWHCHILEHEDNDMMRPLEVSNQSQV